MYIPDLFLYFFPHILGPSRHTGSDVLHILVSLRDLDQKRSTDAAAGVTYQKRKGGNEGDIYTVENGQLS